LYESATTHNGRESNQYNSSGKICKHNKVNDVEIPGNKILKRLEPISGQSK
jgi:hypothetical protein